MTMTKEAFVKKALQGQAQKKKRLDSDLNGYFYEASFRMKKLYRGNLLRPSIRGR
jgi:hypothetical protein